jgi:hypothetical protein
MGGENLRIGYTGVDLSETSHWPSYQQVIIQGSGPLVTNLLIMLGIRFLSNKNQDLKLLGWGLVLSSYRGLIIPPRQLLENRDSQYLKTDETLVAEELHIPRFMISIPQMLLSIFFLTRGYQKLPGNKRLVALSGFVGMALGTILFVKMLGPALWDSQEGTPDLKSMGLSRK